MTTDLKTIKVGGIEINTLRKDIKNLHLGVYPPNGRVRIAVPLKTTDESIRLFAISKISWIRKQRKKFLGQKRQSKRDFVNGESHYFFGRRYLLNVIEQSFPQRVEIKRKTHLDLHVLSENYKQKEKVFEKWYRNELQKVAFPIVKKLEKKLDITVEDIRIKKMKTKWGTCNPEAKRIWINLELVKKPSRCLEYVLAHEMIHFFERNHGKGFIEKMQKIIPHWRSIRVELNDSLLGHSMWA